jgi:hypothetical protein
MHGPGRSYLKALKDLNNIDKHRLLLVVACVFRPVGMWWSSEESDPKPTKIRAHIGPLKDGDRVAWFDFHGAEPPPGFDPHPTLQVAIIEAKTNHLLGRRSVIDALHGMIHTVEWGVVTRCFRELFREAESG